MTPIASDLSYECLQLRRRRGELAAPPLDNTYRRIYRAADLRPFIADVDEGGDAPVTVDRRIDVPQHTIPVWHFRGK